MLDLQRSSLKFMKKAVEFTGYRGFDSQHPALVGWLYNSIVIDVFSRRVVGWGPDRATTNVAIDPLNMAVHRRNPAVDFFLHHSDHGAQYTPRKFGSARVQCQHYRLPMGAVGEALIKALSVSFSATFEIERLHRKVWDTR